jgi:hypothetical protein
MTDTEITYLMIRQVRAETGASHEECRQALEEAGGDARKRPDAAAALRPVHSAPKPGPQPPAQPHHTHETPAERS